MPSPQLAAGWVGAYKARQHWERGCSTLAAEREGDTAFGTTATSMSNITTGVRQISDTQKTITTKLLPHHRLQLSVLAFFLSPSQRPL